MQLTRLADESLYTMSGTAAEHRLRVERAAQERAALRDSELEQQASPLKDPEERIRIWERLHALYLPRAPGHVLVQVIAKHTRLTIGQVHEEQQRRTRVRARPEASPPMGGEGIAGDVARSEDRAAHGSAP